MFRMTVIDPSPLRLDIRKLDKGIEPRVVKTDWGYLLNLYRQGKSTRWSVWFFADGSSRIVHLETATIMGVYEDFAPGEHLLMQDKLLFYIQSGLI